MPSPKDNTSPAPSAPLDSRLHLMVTQAMKLDIEMATGAPGFKSEADVVRYALEQVLPLLLAQARDRYAGRTRMLVDTTDAAPAPVRHDRPAPPRMARDSIQPRRFPTGAPITLEEELTLASPPPRHADAVRRWGEDSAAVGAALDAAHEAVTEIVAMEPPRRMAMDVPLTRDQELGYVVSGDPFAPGRPGFDVE